MMMDDVASYERPLVGDKIGSYNTKFAEKWGKQIVKIFGEDACNVGDGRIKPANLSKYLTELNQKLAESSGTLGQGYEKVSTFSEWLDSLDINDFYNPYEYIELPGQYDGLI